MISETIGYIAGFLTTICLLPQLITVLIRKSSKDVSIFTYVILLCGQILWISYGILVDDLRIIVPNVISGALAIFIVISSLCYGSI